MITSTPGTDGAVSLPGTLAGVAAAGLTAGLGLALGLVGGWAAAGVVALAALLQRSVRVPEAVVVAVAALGGLVLH